MENLRDYCINRHKINPLLRKWHLSCGKGCDWLNCSSHVGLGLPIAKGIAARDYYF